MKFNLIIEKGDGGLWGRVESPTDFMPVANGTTVNEIVEQIRFLFSDYIEHDGAGDGFFKDHPNIKAEDIVFTILYDLQAFFLDHEYLNISAIAVRAEINPSLLRQYSKGIKFPSAERAKKIEETIHRIAEELNKVRLYPAIS